jgi:FkbM family methyltransferase
MDNMKIINFKDRVKAYVREGTSDEFVVSEVFSGEYRKLNITTDDIVADFGCNIGMFTAFALQKGAKKVVSYEADKENYDLACKNMDLNEFDKSRYSLYNLAVVGNNSSVRSFSLNLKKNKGAHSLVPKRGRDTVEVNAININKVIEEHNPTMIKMDIEGGEAECIPAIENFSGIREFIMEFHHAHLNDKTLARFHTILNIMKNNFSYVEYREDPKGAWVSIIYCRK